MIDDVLFDMLDDNSFEMIFWNYFRFPQKRIVLTVLLRLFSFRYQVSTICYKIFMLLGLICYMTFICKWAGKIFVHKIIFVRRTPNILLTKIPYNLYFSYTAFYAVLMSLHLRCNIFFKKGDGLLCQILIILQLLQC